MKAFLYVPRPSTDCSLALLIGSYYFSFQSRRVDLIRECYSNTKANFSMSMAHHVSIDLIILWIEVMPSIHLKEEQINC